MVVCGMKLELISFLFGLTVLMAIGPVWSGNTDFGLMKGTWSKTYNVPKELLYPAAPFKLSNELTIGRVKELIRDKGASIPVEKMDLAVRSLWPLMDDVKVADLYMPGSLVISERGSDSRPRVAALESNHATTYGQ